MATTDTGDLEIEIFHPTTKAPTGGFVSVCRARAGDADILKMTKAQHIEFCASRTNGLAQCHPQRRRGAVQPSQRAPAVLGE